MEFLAILLIIILALPLILAFLLQKNAATISTVAILTLTIVFFGGPAFLYAVLGNSLMGILIAPILYLIAWYMTITGPFANSELVENDQRNPGILIPVAQYAYDNKRKEMDVINDLENENLSGKKVGDIWFVSKNR